jgi:5'-nucleotidase
VARQYSLIQQIRKEVPPVLLLDAGDQFQGTLFYNEYKGKAAQRFMNEFQYQAMTLGNHEFDDGEAVLAEFIQGLKFPVVSANIDASAEPLLRDLIKPFVILDVDGEKIAVIGATTPETALMSSPGKNVIFKDVKDSVSKAVAEVENQGVNKIIVLSHIGYGADQELAASVDGIDVIVGGHSHTYLSSAEPEEDIDQAAGPYPTIVTAPSGDPVLIVQSFWMGKYLGVLNVTFDNKGKLTAWDGKPWLLDSKIQEDVKIKAEVEELSQPLDALRKQVIGSTNVELNGERSVCRFADCNMGNLITDAMLAKTQHLNTQIAILNGGSIRSSIAKGDVTMGMVLTVAPFGNALSVFGLKGEDVWAAIEHGVSRAENPNNDGTGRFPQVSGLRYWWDKAKPAGSELRQLR